MVVQIYWLKLTKGSARVHRLKITEDIRSIKICWSKFTNRNWLTGLVQVYCLNFTEDTQPKFADQNLQFGILWLEFAVWNLFDMNSHSSLVEKNWKQLIDSNEIRQFTDWDLHVVIYWLGSTYGNLLIGIHILYFTKWNILIRTSWLEVLGLASVTRGAISNFWN